MYGSSHQTNQVLHTTSIIGTAGTTPSLYITDKKLVEQRLLGKCYPQSSQSFYYI